MASALNFLSYLRVPIAASTAIVAGLSGILYAKQNELIYPRSMPPDARTNVPTPSDFPAYDLQTWECLKIPTPDGETLHGYLIKPSNASQAIPLTILMFHGNAGNIGHRLPIVGVLDKLIGASYLMLEYRGYGKSTGNPDEKGINIDATAGLDYIRHRADLKGNGIVVYGQSIGGAVGAQLCSREQHKGDIKALILENTFLSIQKMIPSVLPAAKIIAPLCHQYWPTEETMPKIKVPTLMLSGLEDEIVPATHMKRLQEVATAPVKEFKTFPNGTHNDTVTCPGYFEAIADFIQTHCTGRDRKL